MYSVSVVINEIKGKDGKSIERVTVNVSDSDTKGKAERVSMSSPDMTKAALKTELDKALKPVYDSLA